MPLAMPVGVSPGPRLGADKPSEFFEGGNAPPPPGPEAELAGINTKTEIPIGTVVAAVVGVVVTGAVVGLAVWVTKHRRGRRLTPHWLKNWEFDQGMVSAVQEEGPGRQLPTGLRAFAAAPGAVVAVEARAGAGGRAGAAGQRPDAAVGDDASASAAAADGEAAVAAAAAVVAAASARGAGASLPLRPLPASLSRQNSISSSVHGSPPHMALDDEDAAQGPNGAGGGRLRSSSGVIVNPDSMPELQFLDSGALLLATSPLQGGRSPGSQRAGGRSALAASRPVSGRSATGRGGRPVAIPGISPVLTRELVEDHTMRLLNAAAMSMAAGGGTGLNVPEDFTTTNNPLAMSVDLRSDSFGSFYSANGQWLDSNLVSPRSNAGSDWSRASQELGDGVSAGLARWPSGRRPTRAYPPSPEARLRQPALAQAAAADDGGNGSVAYDSPVRQVPTWMALAHARPATPAQQQLQLQYDKRPPSARSAQPGAQPLHTVPEVVHVHAREEVDEIHAEPPKAACSLHKLSSSSNSGSPGGGDDDLRRPPSREAWRDEDADLLAASPPPPPHVEAGGGEAAVLAPARAGSDGSARPSALATEVLDGMAAGSWAAPRPRGSSSSSRPLSELTAMNLAMEQGPLPAVASLVVYEMRTRPPSPPPAGELLEEEEALGRLEPPGVPATAPSAATAGSAPAPPVFEHEPSQRQQQQQQEHTMPRTSPRATSFAQQPAAPACGSDGAGDAPGPGPALAVAAAPVGVQEEAPLPQHLVQKAQAAHQLLLEQQRRASAPLPPLPPPPPQTPQKGLRQWRSGDGQAGPLDAPVHTVPPVESGNGSAPAAATAPITRSGTAPLQGASAAAEPQSPWQPNAVSLDGSSTLGSTPLPVPAPDAGGGRLSDPGMVMAALNPLLQVVVGDMQPPEDFDLSIKPEDLEIRAVIGKGAFGEVYVSGMWRDVVSGPGLAGGVLCSGGGALLPGRVCAWRAWVAAVRRRSGQPHGVAPRC